MLLAYDNGHSRGADEGPAEQFLSRIADARTMLDDVLRQDPGNVDALYVTFENIREDEGASDAAITYLAKALAIDPNNQKWMMELFNLYLRDGGTEDAVALLRPIANNPHGGAEAEEAMARIRSYGGGSSSDQ